MAADYSQIELRIAAMLANDNAMLDQYSKGEDIHLNTAVKMTSKAPDQITKEERKKAKAVNFGMVYGMGAKKFVKYSFESYEVRITLEEAEAARNLFFKGYPKLIPWHNRQRRLAHRYKAVRSPLGRLRHLPDITSADEMVRQEAERQAINSPVQSTASDLMLASLVQLHKILPQKHIKIVGTVHDSLLFEVNEDYVDKYAPVVKEVMEDLDRVKHTFGADITVPIIVDIEYGSHWGEGKPWVDH